MEENMPRRPTQNHRVARQARLMALKSLRDAETGTNRPTDTRTQKVPDPPQAFVEITSLRGAGKKEPPK